MRYEIIIMRIYLEEERHMKYIICILNIYIKNS